MLALPSILQSRDTGVKLEACRSWAWSILRCQASIDALLYLMMRVTVYAKDQMQDLPVFLYIDGAVVVIILLAVVVRLVASVVVRRPAHVRVITTDSRLLP